MFSDLSLFYRELFSRLFTERPGDLYPWLYDYFGDFSTAEGARKYARALLLDLDLAGFDPKGRVVVDAGSGFGVTLLGFARLGARCAIGIEAFRPMARTSRRLMCRWAADLPALVVRGSVHETPLPASSVDFVYCNEALSHVRRPDLFLADAARILKPGGRLMICDGNNALNRRTVRRVHEIWRRFEEGPPGEDVHGHRIDRPYRDRRRELIARRFPDSAAEVQERLAWGTFGLSGEAIVTAASVLIESGKLPDRPPVVDRSPVDPEKGDYIENLIDARKLAGSLRELGFQVRVHAHFGGARGTVVQAANQVLRALTPVTINWARSVKIVATLTRSR